MKGIFFDETPNVGDAKVVRYLDDIGEEVKDSESILGEQLVSSGLLFQVPFSTVVDIP